MTGILLASDLTERSRRAAGRARLLQRQFQTSLTALHVIEEDLPDFLLQRRSQEAEEAIHAALGAGAAGRGEQQPAVDVQAVSGVDHEVIVARAEAYDLVVLGMHRARFLDAFIGTTAERVLRATDRPVLMVKDEPVTSYGRVVIAVDLSPSSKRAAAAATWLAPDAQFFLVNVHDVPFSGYLSEDAKRRVGYDAEIEAAMDELEVELPQAADRRLVRIGDPVPTLRDACDEVGADLLVLATRNRSRLGRTFLGSVAERMLVDLPCDVLVVRGR